jgi:hypothetical protein
MSSFELGGFSEIMGELRAARPGAPEGLRAQVLALGEPAPRRQRSLRRPALLLAPAGIAAAVAAAVVIGVVQSDGGGGQALDSLGATRLQGAQHGAAVGTGAAKESAAIPAPRTRAQRYEAELTLRVHDLSAETKRALRLTRSLGGYVRTVDYGQGQKAGTAYLVVRIPVGRVQQAIVRFSALGVILDQHVSIEDVQAGLDRRSREMQGLRDRISALEHEGTPEATAKAATLGRQLVALQREQAQSLRAASFATVSLALRTKEATAVPPARPGRIERTFDRAGTVLMQELAVLLYVVVVALPLLLLAAAVYFTGRSLRRRSLDRLLENS